MSKKSLVYIIQSLVKEDCIIQKLKIRKNIEIVYLSSPNPEFIVIVTFGVDMLKSTLVSKSI